MRGLPASHAAGAAGCRPVPEGGGAAARDACPGDAPGTSVGQNAVLCLLVYVLRLGRRALPDVPAAQSGGSRADGRLRAGNGVESEWFMNLAKDIYQKSK